MQEIEVLDLFSGTGSIGFEFASRGAVFIEMVENNPIHFRFIKKTVEELKIENIRLHKTDAFIFIPRCKHKYDIIFADPPYDMPRTEIIPELICKSRLLKPNGWLIIEHSVNNSFSSYSWFHELRKYGNVRFSFFRNFQYSTHTE